jgi:hypothetical protein
MSDEQVKNALPQITIPTNYDVLTSEVIGDMLAKARQGNFNPVIVNGIEIDYVEKLYGENSPQKNYLKILSALDPLPFKTVDEKTMLLQAQGCSKVDYILSANVASFVMQLTEDNPDWVNKELKEQRVDVTRMAEEKLVEINKGLIPIMPPGM